MKTNVYLQGKTGAARLLAMLTLLLIPLWASAQYWESGTSKTGSVSKNVNDVWYTISLPEDGEVSLTVEPLSNINLRNITLYAIVDGENVQRAFAWVDGPNRTLTCPNLKPGIYRVKMNANPKNDKASGTFRLTYIFTAPTVKTDPTPNDTWDDCPLLEDGVTLGGHLGYSYDNADTDVQDWFKIEVPKDGKVQFEFRSAPTLTAGCVYLYALNAEGTDLVSRGSKWFDYRDSTMVFEVPNCQAGTYYFSLPLRYNYGIYHLTYRFIPPVTDSDPELNDTWQTASPLSDGIMQHGHLGYAYNNNTDVQDWYKIDVTEDGKLTFVTRSAPTLTIGMATLYALNAEGTDLVSRGSKWLDYPDSTVVFEVPNVSEGTYYLCMPQRYNYGPYDLTYYFTGHSAEADPEPNDDWQTATVLKPGPTVTGQLGYNYNNNTDQQDWYKLNVPEEGKITLTICSEQTLTIGMATINSLKADGSGLTSRASKWLDVPGDTLTFTLNNAAPGDYYLCLPLRYNYGTYSMQYTFTPCVMTNDEAGNDTWETATVFERGTTMDARLGYDYSESNDVQDWFRLDVPEEGIIKLTIYSEKTLTLGMATIYSLKADGSGLTSRASQWLDYPGDTLTFTLNNAAAGAYYLCMPLRYNYGGYRMTYDFIPCAMANDAAGNDSWESATPFERETTKEGRLGYDYSNSNDTQDWFKLEVPEEGIINLTICSEKTLTIGMATINTLKADGSGLTNRASKWLDYPGDTLTFTLNNAAPGDYYLCLPLRYNYGGYSVTYNFIPCAIANDMAGNDTWENATLIENGTTTQGRLGYDYSNSNDTQDWYQFIMPADGSASFTICSEKTLTLGCATIYALNADGTGTVSRTSQWLDYPGDTLVFHKDDLAAGTYYLYMPHRGGYGGYTVKSTFTKNPFYQEKLGNTDFANRIVLEEGVGVQGTLGYGYRGSDEATQAWFDLGLMHGRQIDMNIIVESSHSLSIGVAALYKYTGDNADGTPILTKVAERRLERSSGTISYIDKNTDDSHYVFCLPRYNGYGGYIATFGSDMQQGQVDLAGTSVNVMTEGRNTVRKGVPCENPITITNTSSEKTSKFLVSVTATDNIDIIGFRMAKHNGSLYVPIDSATVLDGTTCEHTVVFLVPSLDPWESYTFTMISEGKGDIAYSRDYIEFNSGPNKIVVNNNTFAVVSILGNVAGADHHINVSDYVVHRIGDVYELTGEQRLKVSQVIDQLDTEKQQTGMAAYSVLSLLKRASDKCGMDLIDATCPLISMIRQHVFRWIYQDITDGGDEDQMDIIDAKAAITDVVASWDPNEMVGPAGVGDEHYIGEAQTINYRILFENKAEAGDAAYRVRVSDELDENVFDISTVRFGETSHDGVGYNWEMKREGNLLTWDIKGIELPPNVNAPEGEGYVSFSVDLKPGLADGTQIKNKATIIFDKNFPIETNEFVNTLDLSAPVTTMAEAYCSVPEKTVYIDCESVDAGSGVASYLLFVKHGDEDYTYVGQYTTGHIPYSVELDPAVSAATQLNEYSFYVLATDNVGNAECIVPSTPSIVTSISEASPLNDKEQRINDKRGGIYNLNGQRLVNPRKGVNIIGGKKVVIK